MRILYVSRLFSGLADGIQRPAAGTRAASPPSTVCSKRSTRADHDLRIVFTVKDDAVGWPGLRNPDLPHRRLRAGHHRHSRSMRTAARRDSGAPAAICGRSLQYRDIRRLMRRPSHPDHRLFRPRQCLPGRPLRAPHLESPVVWRVMGVPPAMHEHARAHAAPSRASPAWAYRAPFSDGDHARAMAVAASNGWTARSHRTPRRRMMLNGVALRDSRGALRRRDHERGSPGPRNQHPLRGASGRGQGLLSPSSMPFRAALDAAPGRFRAFVAGSGPLRRAPMRERAQRRGPCRSHVHFLGQVPHEQVLGLQQNCDVYVSLNQMCNLTNANLEAMRTGVCMIIPAAPGIRGIDVDTDELMPPDTVWRIRGSEDVDGLRDALIHLDAHPDERRQRAEAIFARASTFIPSWDERINAEIELLEQLAAVNT